MSNGVISLEDDRLDNQNTNKNNSVHDEAFIAQKIIELTNIQLNGVATFLSIIFGFGGLIFFLSFILIASLIGFGVIGSIGMFLLKPLIGDSALGILLITYLGGIMYLCLKLINKLVNKMNVIQKLQIASLDIYNMFKQTKNIVEDIPNILTLLETIHSNILFIQKIRFLGVIFSKKSKIKLEQLITLITQISLYVIYNLRSDLIKKMTEQQKGVQSALGEINTLFFTEQAPFMNATYTRLNRQIQQFEKLKEKLI